MPAGERTPRDERRRRLGQNFLRPEAAEHLVSTAGVHPGDLVVDIGAGSGVLSTALARRGADVVAVELDPVWASRLRSLAHQQFPGHIDVLEMDFLDWPPPRRPFRVVACLPFGATTAILHRLLDDPKAPLERADLVVQWEVARKRAVTPPNTLVSTGWAPWWEFHLGPRIPAGDFRPVPRVDGGTLVITRRAPQLLPRSMAVAYGEFVRHHWPFA